MSARKYMKYMNAGEWLQIKGGWHLKGYTLSSLVNSNLEQVKIIPCTS